MSSNSIPQMILAQLKNYREVFQKRSYECFQVLLVSLMTGIARPGIVRASLLSGPGYYNWRRTHTLMRRNRWSHQQLIEKNCETILQSLYGENLPERLFWIVDPTTTEKPFAKKIHGVRVMRRSYKAFGQRSTQKGHGWVMMGLAHKSGPLKYDNLLVGALLKTKKKSATELAKRLLTHARLPKGVKNIMVGDREFGSIKAIKLLGPKQIHTLIRMKRDERVYPKELPERTGKRGRPLQYGESWHVSKMPKKRWGGHGKVQTKVSGRKRWVSVWSCIVRRRGLKGEVKIFRIKLPKKIIYLQSSDLEMSISEAVWGYFSRQTIEPQIQTAKDLGLGSYRGRKAKGVHRWGTMICVAQSLLQQIALVEEQREQLPFLNWGWYGNEKSVGAIQRRLLTMMIQEGLFEGFSARLELDSDPEENSQQAEE